VKLLYGVSAWIALALLVPIASGSSEIRPSGRIRYISNPSTAVHVVLVAHQDDWQLFMGDIVARQIRGGGQVVFVYLTAGDDGRDSLYWATRERSALESTRVALGLAATDSAADQCSVAESLGHPIRKCTIANTESYFLRLPDGRRGGAGFAVHSFESLRKLRAKRIASMTAVDGSTSYKNWADLKSTVNELIGASSPSRIVTIHTNDPNVVVNPHDHFDHRMAGLLVADSRRKNRWNVEYYAGYALATRAANRSKDQARQKKALFLAYDRAMTQVNAGWSAYREHSAFYSDCMVRTYARSVISR
jgi:LmbE family N-acetylglucosaminyl deacetylase